MKGQDAKGNTESKSISGCTCILFTHPAS